MVADDSQNEERDGRRRERKRSNAETEAARKPSRRRTIALAADHVLPSPDPDDRADRKQSRPTPVETLHRTIGNGAIQRLNETGELQPKLTVSQPDDPHEREAERVAEAVLRMDEEEATATRATDVQRAVGTADSPTVDPDLQRQIGSLRSGGRQLPEATRSFFEPRFGRNFDTVRVHTGPVANEAARSIDAKAFTVGQDVVFADGNYQPGTHEGRKLLAHELTHVIQQREGGTRTGTVQRQGSSPVEEARSVAGTGSALGGAKAGGAAARAAAKRAAKRAANMSKTFLLDSSRPEYVKKIDPDAPNNPVHVSKLQSFLYQNGYLWRSAYQREKVPQTPPSSVLEYIEPEAVPRTMAAYVAYETHRRLTEHFEAAAGSKRRQEALDLREFIRGLIDTYPAKIQQFVANSGVSNDRKVEVIGQVVAQAAKMEFLSGTLAVQGTSKKDIWETIPSGATPGDKPWEDSKNYGPLIKEFQKKGPKGDWWSWCTRFATRIQQMVTGEWDVTSSGLKLEGRQNYDPDYTEAKGGKQVGGKGLGPFDELRERLKKSTSSGKAKSGDTKSGASGGTATSNGDETPKEVVEWFYRTHIKPQAGDILVVRRPEADPHRYKAGSKSHTALIERVEGTKIYTIEGNKKGRVTGRIFDLSNEKHVREIIHISRQSIADLESSGSGGGNQSPGGSVTRADLLVPLLRINAILQLYATGMGYIESIGEGEVNAVANVVSWSIPATEGGGAK